MKSISRTFLALSAIVTAFVTGSGTAFAAPKPIEPATSPGSGSTGGGSVGSGSDLLGSWPLAILVVVIALAGLALLGHLVRRVRQHAPTAA